MASSDAAIPSIPLHDNSFGLHRRGRRPHHSCPPIRPRQHPRQESEVLNNKALLRQSTHTSHGAPITRARRDERSAPGIKLRLLPSTTLIRRVRKRAVRSCVVRVCTRRTSRSGASRPRWELASAWRTSRRSADPWRRSSWTGCGSATAPPPKSAPHQPTPSPRSTTRTLPDAATNPPHHRSFPRPPGSTNPTGKHSSNPRRKLSHPP